MSNKNPTHKFPSGDAHPRNGGRPRKVDTAIRGVPKDAQLLIYKQLHRALECSTKAEAIDLLKSHTTDRYGFVFELAVYHLNGKNGWQTFSDILDRLFGKPRQTSDVSLNTGDLSLDLNIIGEDGDK